ncbi:hypothetical protein CK203_100477 [Vitis vinifera]|uniref:Retrotransposon gag domain-containing protein n=1 Tax=Vitis vinifera TaxID=29760 RepID=A0A438CUX8_VITVI|nr:hypothetical protein CK203_100477 [Vitis vinifera]
MSAGLNSSLGGMSYVAHHKGDRLRVQGVGTLSLMTRSAHHYPKQLHPDSPKGHVVRSPIRTPQGKAHGTREHHTPDDSISYPDMLSGSLTNVSKPCYVIPPACYSPYSAGPPMVCPDALSRHLAMDSKELSSISDCFGTNGLKRQISNFSAKENEKFYEVWERYMEAINACPHHGFDTWLLVSYFYETMKQLLETMCGGDFMSKNPEEAMDFLSYVAEVSRGWDEPNRGEVGKMKSNQILFMLRLGCTP